MIHIATVHWRSDRWIDIQLRYLERNVDEPYRVYAWIDEELRGHAHKFFYATDVAGRAARAQADPAGGPGRARRRPG